MAKLFTHRKFCEAVENLQARDEVGPLQFAAAEIDLGSDPDFDLDLNRSIALVLMLVEMGRIGGRCYCNPRFFGVGGDERTA